MPEESSPLIEALKKAGEELKETEKTATSRKVSKPKEPSLKDYNPPTTRGARVEREGGGGVGVPPKGRAPEKEKTDLAEVKVENEILSQDWLKEITNERQKLEQAYKEVENLRREIQQRLDRMRNLEANFSRVKNELTHFQQIKKENQAFLEEIKNILRKEDE